MIEDKESEGRYQISESDEEKMIEDIVILNLQNLSSQKIYISWEGKWWKKSYVYEWQQGLRWKRIDR